MANEAVYHKGCHADYIKIKEKVPQSERDAAFSQFLEQTEPIINVEGLRHVYFNSFVYKDIMNNVSKVMTLRAQRHIPLRI